MNSDKVYIITDRNLSYSDSVARYIIDLANALTPWYKVTVYSTNSTKANHKRNGDFKPDFSFCLKNGLPSPNDQTIFHFHLTFTIREHTRYLIENTKVLKKKSVVTFHVDPEYALAMGQGENIKKVLEPLAQNDFLTYVFSNYSKSHFKKHGINKIWVLYPGLDLKIYDKYKTHKKLDQALFIASNPDNRFVRKIKGHSLLPMVRNLIGFKYKVVSKVDVPFNDYLELMAKSKFYLALGEYEHYGFAIIDAFNLGTIPIYNNKAGLTESVYARGIPLFVQNPKILNKESDFSYDFGLVSNNHMASQIIHDIDNHVAKVLYLYKLI